MLSYYLIILYYYIILLLFYYIIVFFYCYITMSLLSHEVVVDPSDFSENRSVLHGSSQWIHPRPSCGPEMPESRQKTHHCITALLMRYCCNTILSYYFIIILLYCHVTIILSVDHRYIITILSLNYIPEGVGRWGGVCGGWGGGVGWCGVPWILK